MFKITFDLGVALDGDVEVADRRLDGQVAVLEGDDPLGPATTTWSEFNAFSVPVTWKFSPSRMKRDCAWPPPGQGIGSPSTSTRPAAPPAPSPDVATAAAMASAGRASAASRGSQTLLM